MRVAVEVVIVVFCVWVWGLGNPKNGWGVVRTMAGLG